MNILSPITKSSTDKEFGFDSFNIINNSDKTTQLITGIENNFKNSFELKIFFIISPNSL